MSDTYIVTAKTIDEAIAKANKLYADADHEISYDILEMPKKGFLGIGAKDAMLKVTVTEVRDADLSSIVSDLKSMKMHTDRDGRQNEPKKEKQPNQQSRNQHKPAEQKPAEKKPAEQKPAEKKPTEQKPAEKKPAEQKPAEKKPAEQRPAEKKPAEQKPAEKKPAEQKPAEQKPAEKAEEKASVMPKEHSEVIVSAPVGLFDLPEKEAKKGWGHAEPAVPVSDAAEEAEEEEIPAAAEKDVKVAVSEEEMQYALDFANTLLRNMQIDAKAQRAACPEGQTFETSEGADVYPAIEIVGEGSGILIGHHGETLDAIQYLVNLSAIRKTKKANGHGDYVKIVVDVENYRSKREETLRSLARRMAARAVKSKRNVFLEPMNAYERRIIHSELQSYPDVSTHSVGSDKNRKIIITYEGADKQPSNSRRRGQKNKSEAQKNEKRTPKPAAKTAPAKADAAKTAEKTERPRPKKPQKMPIEQLPDFLASRSTEPDEFLGIED